MIERERKIEKGKRIKGRKEGTKKKRVKKNSFPCYLPTDTGLIVIPSSL